MSQSRPGPVLAVFAPDSSDARLARRVQAFRTAGTDVMTFAFVRDLGWHEGIEQRVVLGATLRARYGQRLLALARATRVVWSNRGSLSRAQHFYAINFDNAALALVGRRLLRSATPVTLEMADVQPVMTSNRSSARILRWLERRVLDRCDLVVTTSPGFVSQYLEPLQDWRGPVFLLENKVFPPISSSGPVPRTAKDPAEPWRVGYFGLLRCRRSWEMIARLARRLDGRVEFVLAGVPQMPGEAEFAAQVAATPHCTYLGPYRYPDDLPDLYTGVHLSWAFDFWAADGSSQWLLPNRLYEAGPFCVPSLAERGTEAGSWVERRGAGWTFGPDVEDQLFEFLSRLDEGSWQPVREHLASLPPDEWDATADHRQLIDLMFR